MLVTARSVLWTEGVQIVWRLVGKSHDTCRRLTGKLVKLMRDDAAATLELLREAEANCPIAPADFLVAAARCRGSRAAAAQQAHADMTAICQLYEAHILAGGIDADDEAVREKAGPLADSYDLMQVAVAMGGAQLFRPGANLDPYRLAVTSDLPP